jgi:hypothetical protein
MSIAMNQALADNVRRSTESTTVTVQYHSSLEPDEIRAVDDVIVHRDGRVTLGVLLSEARDKHSTWERSLSARRQITQAAKRAAADQPQEQTMRGLVIIA